MNPDVWGPRIQAILVVVGGAMVALAHSGLIAEPAWSQLLGELGALLAGKELLKRTVDLTVREHERALVEFADSIRPPPPPPE